MVICCLRLSDVSVICSIFNPRRTSQKIWHVTLKLAVIRSRPSVPYGAIFSGCKGLSYLCAKAMRPFVKLQRPLVIIAYRVATIPIVTFAAWCDVACRISYFTDSFVFYYVFITVCTYSCIDALVLSGWNSLGSNFMLSILLFSTESLSN